MTITLAAILTWLLIGLVIGGLAHLLVPGRNRVGVVRTVLFGIAGAFVGGLVTAALLGPGHAIITFIVALIVAALLIAAVTNHGYLRGRYRSRYHGRNHSRYRGRRWARR
jgi:uncharacterized membrane protein YeaQ/YmgE (transglycosylase-associated protein family)